MEHLLLPGERVPIRLPNYQPRPDEDGNIQGVDDCTALFGAAVKQEIYPASGENETTALWIQHCHKRRVYNLCHVLLDQFYFGLIYQILGPDVVVADFTVRDEDGSVFLTTTKLEEYLLSWEARVHQLDKDQKQQLSDRVYSMLYQAMLVLRSLMAFLEWSYTNVPVKQAYPDDEEPLGNTHFACAMLHQALVRSRAEIFGIGEVTNYELAFNAPWLVKRMEREGWCPYTIELLQIEQFVDSIAYAYYLATVRTDTADHGHCSSVACFANNIPTVEKDIKESSRRHLGLKHVNAGCDCWIIEAPLTEIHAILQQGRVPILRIGTDDGYKLTLHAHMANTDARKYIALSHVWVDGLGSPYSNTITQCQLTRIADRLGKLAATESCGELCVWIDTLCVPVDSQHSQLRQLAIMNMHKVYRDAYAVMVMDADLLKLHGRPSLMQLGMRLRLSAWSSRLWTFQEGALNNRLLIVTTDSLLDIDEYLNSWNNDTPRRKLQHIIAGYALRAMTRIRGPRNLNTSLPARPLPSVREDDGHQAFELAAQALFNAIFTRTSSRADDEVIVIATYLDLPLSSILAHHGDERVIALLRAMPSIPSCLIFAEGERLGTAGFKWCPRSFTRAKGSNAVQDLDSEPTDYPAEDIFSAPPAAKLDHRSRGLWTFNAAIKLDRVLQYEPEGEYDGLKIVFELVGILHFFDPGPDDPFLRSGEPKETLRAKMEQMSISGRELAILVPEPIDSGHHLRRAALLELTGEMDDDVHEGTLVAKYVMSGYVERAQTAGVFGFETMKEVIQAAGHEPGDYRAEWIQQRYWLVD